MLFVLNLAVQVTRANADDSMFAWQTGYSESLDHGISADSDRNGVVEKGECVRRAVSLIISRVIFGKQEAGAENFGSRSVSEAVHKTSFVMDFDENEISLGAAWAF